MQAAAAFLVNIDGMLDAALDLATSLVSCCLSPALRLLWAWHLSALCAGWVTPPFAVYDFQSSAKTTATFCNPDPLMRRAQLLQTSASPLPPVSQCSIFFG